MKLESITFLSMLGEISLGIYAVYIPIVALYTT